MAFGITAAALGAVLSAALVQAPAPMPAMPGMTATAETCPAGPPPLPAALSGWSSRAPLDAAASPAGLGSAALTVGRAVDATLSPAAGVSYAAAPGKPAAPGARAGLLALSVDAPGTYAVGLSSGAWIDMVDARGATLASAAHGHGPPCSGIRKVVDFAMQPGRYVVQLTSPDPVVGVLVFRR